MKKGLFFILGIIFTLGILFLVGSSFAGPKECPKGHTNNCDTYKQKNHPDQLGCFPKNAFGDNAQGWVFKESGCNFLKDDDDENPSETQKPAETQSVPVQTEAPSVNPDPPEEDNSTNTNNSNTNNSDLPVVVVDNLDNCPDNCICLLVTAMVEQNQLLEEQNQILENMNK